MSSTTLLSSSGTKMKRTRSNNTSLLLSPSKRNRPEVHEEKVQEPPKHKDLFSWTLSPEAIAPCHIRDVLSLQDRPENDKPRGPSDKLSAADFYWLGRVPCRNVQIVGIVVGVSQYESRSTYIVDDGTDIIECSLRTQPIKQIPQPGRPPPIAPEFPPPVASVGETVRVIGKVSKGIKFGDWQIAINTITLCSSGNDEFKHYMDVLKLHETRYSPTIGPFSIPRLALRDIVPPTPRPGPSTPTRKSIVQEPSSGISNYNVQSSPVTIIASSPIKNESIPASPTKLRHPSRLHHAELTRNTFRIYLKYFMDSGPSHSTDDVDYDDRSDPFAPSFANETSASLLTPTKDSTPRPTFSKSMSRPKIDPLDFSKFSTTAPLNDKPPLRGYSISYLRRVPELVLLANRVAKQEIRLARKQAKEKEKKDLKAKPTSSASSSTAAKARLPTIKDIKRLFIRAVNDLYREGSIVIWDCPSYSCSDVYGGDTSFLWKTSTSMSYPPTADSTANSSSKSTLLPNLEGESKDGELSDPDSNEDVYISLTPVFLAKCLEEVIPIVQEKERKRVASSGRPQPYRGASVEGLLHHLKTDDKWTFVHIDSVEAALKYLEEDGRAWMSGKGQWQLTV
ncbi:hypothetical protein D9611_011981 [Ephemerocybe angulata]|uniref:CST complex subunit Stn1 N-terminal domain-containing protein n=1 Tax=Ephemerocybe angulata TaxID=980116 RepID=A0A8H5FFH3_9AGAR|nr:hypothetical protein D9611_011981 [Tulosesus angulatus]